MHCADRADRSRRQCDGGPRRYTRSPRGERTPKLPCAAANRWVRCMVCLSRSRTSRTRRVSVPRTAARTSRTTCPAVDAGIVARIRAAGGIVIGKTNVPELSIGANTVNRLFGATGNPFDVTLTCGGSSGGSAVAVATNMAPLATGSDHGGSLRIPACYSGVVGYRATPGVVPNERRTMVQTNYSVQGPMARTVADAALLLSVIAERSNATRRDPMTFPLDASRFARLDPIDVSTAARCGDGRSGRRPGVRRRSGARSRIV